MRRERDIQSPESLEPNYHLREIVPGARGFKLTSRDFLRVALVGALATQAACAKIGSRTPPHEGTATNPTEIVPPFESTPTQFVEPSSTPTETPKPTETPEPTPIITATEWQVVGKDYLVSIGENNVPEYRFVEGEGWQEVEQISMVDAFGNTVPGWVVEKSDEWEGEISQTSKLLIGGRYNPVSETSLAIISSATLKQWQLMEFINSDGVKMQKLNFTWIFKNDENKVITVKVGMPELNYGARIEKLTPRQFMDSLVVGGQTEFLVFIWVDTLSAMTPEKRAEFFTGYARDGELCKQSVQACGLSIGRMGEVKHPTSWFDDIYHGLYGDNIDIANEAWCQRPVK